MTALRTWLLRRLARRLQIGEDILSHLSTFQRLGEAFEIEAPTEMLPVGARTIVRALRSRAAPQIRPDWVWPWWMERQLDPTSEAFVPRGHLAVLTNVTHRNWTAIGALGSPWEAVVDPAGLVTPWDDGWSIDWWVDTDGGWWFPSRAARLEQRVDASGAPVVETLGPGVRHRAFTQVGAIGETAVVELHNVGDRPCRVAVSLRPANPEGLAVVRDIEASDRVVSVAGHLALLLPATPEITALSTFHDGDVSELLLAGYAGDGAVASRHDPAGLAQAAFVYSLPAGERLSVQAPMVPGPEQPRDLASTARRSADPPRTSEQIVAAWSAPLKTGLRIEVPDARLQQAVDANRAYQLLLHDPGSITPGPLTYHRFWFRDAAYQTVALDRWGFHAEAADVLATFPDRQRADGFFYSQWREWDANGAAIWAIAEHHRLTGDDDLLRHLAPAVAKGARWIARKRREHRRGAPEIHGLLPAGVSAEHLGPFDIYYWDDFFALRGLRDAAYVAAATGDHEAAAEHERVFAVLLADVRSSIRHVGERLGVQAIPAGPRRGIDPGMIGSLVACEPLRVFDPDDPYVAGTLALIDDRFCLGPAFFQGISHTGLGTYLTLQLAFVELERGEPRAWERLRWLLDAATDTFTWPEAIHPRLDGGCMGDGHHGWASADFLSFVRNTLVRELRDGSVALLGVLPEEWIGERVVVHDAPTHAGRVSFTLDWDGRRPRLRWDAERGGARLRAPGLDPGWSTDERSGETTFDAI